MKELNPFYKRFKSWCCVHWKLWQILALLALALLLLASMARGDPVSGWAGDPRSSPSQFRGSEGDAVIVKPTTTPVPVGLSETPTPFPPEILNNHAQTNGVVFIGGLIVLIIVLGTIGVNRSRRKE